MQLPCAHDVLHYTVQALRAREKRAVVLPNAFGLLALVAGWYEGRGRGDRRTLRSHDCQRASRKLSVHAVVLCA